MAASLPERKRKFTKAQRKSLQREKARKATEKRGIGIGSRQDVVLPARWHTEVREFASNKALVFVSPGKSRYSKKRFTEILAKENMDLCFMEQKSSESGSVFSDSSEDFVTKLEVATDSETELCEMERSFFVCESTQITKLIDQVNSTSKCSTPDCNGE